jgi:hypothetical protein
VVVTENVLELMPVQDLSTGEDIYCELENISEKY